MINESAAQRDLNKKAFISGIFFVFVQILVRGVTFFLTPVYSRLLSKAQYGDIKVFESWTFILTPVLSLSLYRGIERAKFDFRTRFNQFVSSSLILSCLSIAVSFSAVILFFRKPFMSFFELDSVLFTIMILQIFAFTANLYYQRRERQLLRYKSASIVTGCMMLPAAFLSVLLIYIGHRTGHTEALVDLRTIGFFVPQILGGLIVFFIMVKDGKTLYNRQCWKYAVIYSVPLIPEIVSVQIMNQSDKIMIKKLIGAESTGVYSLASNISYIIWILADSVWASFIPWMYEKLDREENDDIRTPWYSLTVTFSFFSWMLVILAPELIMILGGSRYEEGSFVVAPMVLATLFRFFCYIFGAMINFRKKTGYTSATTIASMIINIILNYICIRKFGYQAAAYTTAVSYLILLLMQGIAERILFGSNLISLFKMLLFSVLVAAVDLLSVLTFRWEWWMRWAAFLLASSAFLILMRPRLKRLLSLLT